MMKRILMIALTLALVGLIAGPARAIDVKKKSGSTHSASAPADSSSANDRSEAKAATNKSLLERLKTQVRESSKQPDSTKYDNYIDANNDGVDDRVSGKQKSKDDKREKASAPQPTHRVKSDSGEAVVKKKNPR